ncbi:hypothetical protein B0H13DRAFT_2670022 [Mycena leptocephala]|nr:hypothetical protein B0H13DRAFT_2670022 [Mycena leptocephala]
MSRRHTRARMRNGSGSGPVEEGERGVTAAFGVGVGIREGVWGMGMGRRPSEGLPPRSRSRERERERVRSPHAYAHGEASASTSTLLPLPLARTTSRSRSRENEHGADRDGGDAHNDNHHDNPNHSEAEWVTLGARDWAPDAASVLRSVSGAKIPSPPKTSPACHRSCLVWEEAHDESGKGTRGVGVAVIFKRRDASYPGCGIAVDAEFALHSSHIASSTPSSTAANGGSGAGLTTHPNGSHPKIIASLPSESPVHSPQSSDAGCEGDNCEEHGDGEGTRGCKGKGGGGCRAKDAPQTRSALRRILDEAPKPPPPPRTQFLPRSPPPAPHAAPSTATASVSRLFSKGGRHSVTTQPQQPVVGIMKGGRNSAPATPAVTTPTTGTPPEGSSAQVGAAGPSNPSAEREPQSKSIPDDVLAYRRTESAGERGVDAEREED